MAPFPKWRIEGVIDHPTKHCLRQQVNERSWHMIRLYQHYKSGFLPYAGGILNQPNPFLRAMETLDAAVNSKNAQETKS